MGRVWIVVVRRVVEAVMWEVWKGGGRVGGGGSCVGGVEEGVGGGVGRQLCGRCGSGGWLGGWWFLWGER